MLQIASDPRGTSGIRTVTVEDAVMVTTLCMQRKISKVKPTSPSSCCTRCTKQELSNITTSLKHRMCESRSSSAHKPQTPEGRKRKREHQMSWPANHSTERTYLHTARFSACINTISVEVHSALLSTISCSSLQMGLHIHTIAIHNPPRREESSLRSSPAASLSANAD